MILIYELILFYFIKNSTVVINCTVHPNCSDTVKHAGTLISSSEPESVSLVNSLFVFESV